MNTQYKNLLSPYKVCGKTFKNRMLSGPLGFCVPNEGCIHARNLEYYEIQASGGAARVTTNDYSVGGGGLGGVDFSNIDIELEKSLQEYVRTMHRHDCLAFTEFAHGGYPVRGDITDPDETPSKMPHVFGEVGMQDHPPGGPGGGMPPGMEDANKTIADLTYEEMDRLCDQWALCCRNAMSYGLDGAILHGGHNKLIDQFRSVRHNKRTDEFGGSLENRARFPIMLLERIRGAVGKDFIIELRLSADEGYEGGITIDETVEFLKLIDGRGLIDLFHVTAGDHTTAWGNMHTSSPAFFPETPNRPYAKAIKAAGIKTPLVLINSINDPDIAEDIIASGDAEFVCMARQIAVADPFFPRKVKEARIDAIDSCIRCHNCFDREECAVNPITMNRIYKLTYRLPEARVKKKVAVVGGGIAGLKAASTAAELGHDVTLFEKRGSLGGALRFADTDSYKVDIKRYKDRMINRVQNDERIKIRLEVEAEPEMLQQEGYEAVIVAIGAEVKKPGIKGIDGDNVLAPLDVYDYPERLGDRIVVVGGGLQACEIAMHLAHTGKKVTILCRRDRLAPNEKINNDVFDPIPAMKKIFRAYEQPVEYILDCECTEVFGGGVHGRLKDGTKITVEADTVVLSAGMRAKTDEAYAFNTCAPFVQIAGDCREAMKIKQAVAGGYYSALDV